MLPITIWMNMPSFYQDDLFRELSKKVDLRVVYDHVMTEDRRQLGWVESKKEYNSCILQVGHKVRQAVKIARSEPGRVHIINGIWAEKAFAAAAIVLGWSGTPFAIYSERPDPIVSRGLLKRVARRSIGRWIARNANALFAISHLATDYFSGLGFPPNRIYPFGYFRASPLARAGELSTTCVGAKLDILYIGQLIRRKGLDILMQAVKPLLYRYPKLQVSLVGSGIEQSILDKEICNKELADRIILEGVLPSNQVHLRLARASALILPSRWDGWGLVINEAFSAGVPVIASDRCGAADLIVPGVNGYRFRSESVDDLRDCLSAFVNSDQRQMRAAALKTGIALTIPVVSEYLVGCLEHMCGLRPSRPLAPWETTLRELESEHGQPNSLHFGS